MRILTTMICITTALFVLTGFNGFWQDSVTRVDRTSVYLTAIGGDVHLIQPVHRHEAEAMVSFAETYNQIAYNSDLPPKQRCAQLEQAGREALQRREKSFANLHEVTCTPSATGPAPELVMTIWPQMRHSYRFIITFKPTS